MRKVFGKTNKKIISRSSTDFEACKTKQIEAK